jgi:uncharacterized protein YdiU (UPF0061 family)
MHALVNPVNSLPWQHRFAGLGDTFSSRVAPTPLQHLHWIAQNTSLATELGLPTSLWGQDEWLQALGGSTELPGSQCLASVYSGHQCGVWAGQLGDGRALSLGEINTPMGIQTLQLKGAGMTPYSRMADGRAVLRSSIREYLCSEAMHGLGIPTTRALALVGSPDKVLREELETAAVVTRVAPSFVRFGHVEHFAAKGQTDALRRLTDFVIEHHFPHLLPVTGAQRYLALLGEVTERTASLLAHWQSVGFCHGVMNTDNMSILGLTIDYGPFQFLDGFNPAHICNHSDHQGRYAYARQPQVAYWNLFCLGQALLPLTEDQDATVATLEGFKQDYPRRMNERFAAKLGFTDAQASDPALLEALLGLLATEQTDFTIFWRRLSHAVGHLAAHDAAHAFQAVRDLFIQASAWDAWLPLYLARIDKQDPVITSQAMLRTNPKFVLRNHLGEQAIQQAKIGHFDEIHVLHRLLSSPFDEHPGFDSHAAFPPDWASSIAISCSS